MSENDWIRVEVCYALPERQWLLTLSVPASASAADAVERSGLAAKVPVSYTHLTLPTIYSV